MSTLDDVKLQIIIDAIMAHGFPAVADLIPDTAIVKKNEVYANGMLTGEYDPLMAEYAEVGDVREGVDRGDGQIGTLNLPTNVNVRSGIGYGEDRIEFTGRLSPVVLGAPQITCSRKYNIVTLRN